MESKLGLITLASSQEIKPFSFEKNGEMIKVMTFQKQLYRLRAVLKDSDLLEVYRIANTVSQKQGSYTVITSDLICYKIWTAFSGMSNSDRITTESQVA